MALLKRAAALAATAALVCSANALAQSLEYQVKAAYILNFTKFVEFPPMSFDDESAPLRVCVGGQDPFEGGLGRTMAGERFGTHPIAVTTVAQPAAAAGCHILFVPRSQGPMAQQWIRAAAGTVLSIGEQPDFLRLGGGISFLVDAGHVRFDVNPIAASGHGVQISSRLLRVARATFGQAGAAP